MHSRKHICKFIQAIVQTKGLKMSICLSNPSNRLSGRIQDYPRLNDEG